MSKYTEQSDKYVQDKKTTFYKNVKCTIRGLKILLKTQL